MAEKLAKVRVQIVDEATKLPKENVDVITSADAVYFPDGQTFQEKWENGDFKGDPGEDGAVATVKVGETITINPGSEAIVENIGTKHAAVLNFAIPKGEKGEDGTSIKILGRYDTEEELFVNYPNGVAEDGGFMIGPDGGPCVYYIWNKRTLKWESIGSIQGPQGEVGEKGDPGEDGRGLAIKTTFPNYAKLVEAYPDGSVCEGLGCITLDTKEYWCWDIIKCKWVSIGCIIGSKGDRGDAGTIKIGTVSTGSPASVTNVGTETNAVFNFVVPKGDKGDKGEYAEVDGELDPNSNNPISNKAVASELNKMKKYFSSYSMCNCNYSLKDLINLL